MLLPILLAGLLAGPSQRAELEVDPWPCEVVRVVDGDTLHVRRAGALEKLRLLSVDTEEKIAGRPSGSPLKPETVFGEETAHWAPAFFEDLAPEGAAATVRLGFPGGREEYDVYGRLLCHVVLPDGRDYNLLLVETGRSPYFNKYGNSRCSHDAFVRAQRRARAARLGIWDPRTNRARTPGAPEARRPYDRLLPWWQARAEAIDAFRERRAAEPARVVAADDEEAVRAAFGGGADVTVFGAIERFYEERDGSLTVRFRGTRAHALRATVPAILRGGAVETMLRASSVELRQNYLFVEGRLVEGPRGPLLIPAGAEAWRLAGPEPGSGG